MSIRKRWRCWSSAIQRTLIASFQLSAKSRPSTSAFRRRRREESQEANSSEQLLATGLWHLISSGARDPINIETVVGFTEQYKISINKKGTLARALRFLLEIG